MESNKNQYVYAFMRGDDIVTKIYTNKRNLNIMLSGWKKGLQEGYVKQETINNCKVIVFKNHLEIPLQKWFDGEEF